MTKRIVVELGATRGVLPTMVAEKAKRVMLVTDKGLMKLGLVDETLKQMRLKNVDVHVFDDVCEDPSEDIVVRASAQAKELGVEAVVGFGGGSSMDVAKLVAVLASERSTQSIDAMYGIGMIDPATERLPLFQVPTTAGTGSEVTQISILTTGASEKKGVVDPILLPDVAVLDGELTASVPKHITSATGIDAMVHAIEAYTSKIKKNPLSDALAEFALKLLGRNIRRVVLEDPLDMQARSDMLLGSCCAGMAFANSPVAAVHALAYPIGSHFHVPHGLSNALMLAHVMRANNEVDQCAKQYSEVCSAFFIFGPGLYLKLHPGVRSSRNSMKVLTARTDVSYLRDYETGGEEGYAGRFCAFRVFLFFSNPASPISPVHSLCLSVGVCGTSPSPQGLNAPALFYASSPWQGI